MKRYILVLLAIVMISTVLLNSSWKSAGTVNKTATRISFLTPADSLYNIHVHELYASAHLGEAGLTLPVFEKALTGFYNLKKAGQLSSRSVLSIADFDQPSSRKRLYIIDLDQKKLLLNTWVAHGQNSGNDLADHFSNKNDSFASSLGFYVTGEIYRGIHGRSLKLDGVDYGFNDKARSRSIVVHGAPYVSAGTINALGRLGRSQGCPAVSPEVADKVINTIEDKTVLFINKTIESYSSKYLNGSLAADFAMSAYSSAE